MIDGRKVKPLYRLTDEGRERLCRSCETWWPTEPDVDADGRPVPFWIRWQAQCVACIYERNQRRMRERYERLTA